MPEIAEAQALLAALAETDEVKAAEAQRQRRLDLQTSYSQAMMWAKGFAAEETRAAFSRATEIQPRPTTFRIASQRPTSVELRLFARRIAVCAGARTKLPEEAEDAGRVVEAGVARRGLALASYLALIFSRRGPLRAGSRGLRRRERKGDTGTLPDATGPLVVSVLAVTMWQLGEVDARAN